MAFVVGRRWTLVSASLNPANAGHNGMRAEVAVNTPGAELQVDGASTRRRQRPRRPAARLRRRPSAAAGGDPAAARAQVCPQRRLLQVEGRRVLYARDAPDSVRDVPEGGRVELRCKAKGCPTKKTVTRKRIATTSFKTLFGKRRMRAGGRSRSACSRRT